MGFRIQKSIRLGNHVRINLSKSGIGASVRFLGVTLGAGPYGYYISVDLPGSGLSFREQWGGRRRVGRGDPMLPLELSTPNPSPGFFASSRERKLAKGLKDYQAGKVEPALKHFLAVASQEPGAAIMAATILAEQEAGRFQAIELLEGVVQSDAVFPTPLMEKYLTKILVKIAVAPNVEVTIPVNGLAATLLLIELYQSVRWVRQAIALLEEVTSLSNEPVVILSLCDLYASRNLWDEIIDRTRDIESVDDVTTSLLTLQGRAMQEKGLHEDAVMVFNKVLRRKIGRIPGVIHEAIYWRAISYEAQGKPDQARREWRRIYAEDTDFRDVARRLGINLGR